MRIAVIQLGYDDREPVADRVTRAAGLVRAQAGHDLVVLPELWAPGGFAYQSWAERAEPVDGPVASAMSAAARDAGVMVHAGSIIERPADGVRGPDGKELWNTSLVFAADGSLAATYRKIHRFGFGRGEPVLLEAGDALSLVDVPDSSPGDEPARAALSTCYDLRFPELYRAQLDAGATLFVIP
ncbi:MAG TPA: nitrilase-related carbon-nitrogen hydrolase, partial [Dermatophilaceae bacterium]